MEIFIDNVNGRLHKKSVNICKCPLQLPHTIYVSMTVYIPRLWVCVR